MEAFHHKERNGSRSRSRGREPLVSTGRGGSGNIRESSQGPLSVDDGVTAPVERGRHVDGPAPSHQVHSGRGGAGNIRSPSRDPADKERIKHEDALEAQLIRDKRAAEAGEPRMSGRGGWGNISSRSRSREPASKDASPAPHPHGHSSGRGGAGNQWEGKPDDASTLSTLDERAHSVRESYDAKRDANGVTSTGKGGAGNMHALTDMAHEDRGTAPHTEHPHGHTSGRGGAGNYVPSPSEGTPPDSRGRSPHGNGGNHRGPLEAVKDMVRGLSRSKSRDRKD